MPYKKSDESAVFGVIGDKIPLKWSFLIHSSHDFGAVWYEFCPFSARSLSKIHSLSCGSALSFSLVSNHILWTVRSGPSPSFGLPMPMIVLPKSPALGLFRFCREMKNILYLCTGKQTMLQVSCKCQLKDTHFDN